LSKNNLSYIESGALLAASQSLEELYLNDNIHLDLSELEASKIFQPMKALTILYLHNCNISCSDAFLSNLSSLKTLSIDRLEYVTFGESFLHMSNLTSLNLYGRMRVMSNDTFLTLVNCPLKKLNVKSTNTLSVLEPSTFSALSRLETLDLGYNRGIGLRNVSRAWYGLRNTNIETLVLSFITADSDSPKIDKTFYEYLSESNIQNLLLDRNNIEEVNEGFANAFPNIRHMDFSYNSVYHGAFEVMSEIRSLKQLRFLDGSNQIRRYIEKRDKLSQDHLLQGTNNLILKSHFHTNQSSLKSYSDDWSTCKAAQSTPCTFSNIPPRGPWCFPFPSKLETLNLSASVNIRNVQLYQITVLGNISHLKNLMYKSNGLSILTGPIMFNTASIAPLLVDLSDNEASCLAPDILKTWVSVIGQKIGQLILANNNLGPQLEQDSGGKVFQYYQTLNVLNLARNNIKSLPYDIFTNLSELNVLNLSGNSLRILGFKMTHFCQLKVLDLSDNLITNLDLASLQQMDRLVFVSNVTVMLKGNPIECSCDCLPLLRWLRDNKNNLKNIKDIACLLNHTLVTFDHLADVILVRLEFSCSTNLILKVAGALLGLGILSVVVSIFLYRHRWDIRYFMLQLRKNSNAYIRLVDSSTCYEYDAFVSYHFKDIQWVRQELAQYLEAPLDCNLENEAASGVDQRNSTQPLRLCIHQRDFDVGELIEDNILKSIQQSKRVILVISPHFLESQWCLFEFEIARKQSLIREINIIIPILLESVELEMMPPTLQLLFRNNTYIEWNPHSSESENFWRRLKRVLVDPFEM